MRRLLFYYNQHLSPVCCAEVVQSSQRSVSTFTALYEAGEGILPVQFGSFHQGVRIPVFNHHLAAQTHKALGVVLVLSGYLDTQTQTG